MKTSEQEVDYGRKCSGASVLNNKRQSSSENSHERSVGDGPGNDNNDVIRGPMNAEKYSFHQRSVARHAPLKLTRAQGCQVPRRQEQHLSYSNETTIEKQSKQLLERQPRKPPSSQNDDGESVTLRIGNYDILKETPTRAESLSTFIESTGALWKEAGDKLSLMLNNALVRNEGISSPLLLAETPSTSVSKRAVPILRMPGSKLERRRQQS